MQEVLEGMVGLLCESLFHVEAKDKGVVVEAVRADAEDRAHGVNDDFWLTVVVKHSRADAERVAVHFPELYASEDWVEDTYNEKGGISVSRGSVPEGRRLVVDAPFHCQVVRKLGAEALQDAPVESAHIGYDAVDRGCVNLRREAGPTVGPRCPAVIDGPPFGPLVYDETRQWPPFALAVLAVEVLLVHQVLHEELFEVLLRGLPQLPVCLRDAMRGQLPLDAADEVVGVFEKHFTIDRLRRT